MPWSVRGIDPEIREQAVEAAHRSGMSVGEWMNQVLAGNLDDDDEPAPARSRKRRSTRGDDLSERLDRLGRNRSATAMNRVKDDTNDNGRVLDLIETAVEAIERLERSSARRELPEQRQSPQDLSQIIDMLERRMSNMAEPTAMPARTANGRPAAFMRPARAQAPDESGLLRAISEIDQRRRELDGGMTPSRTRHPVAAQTGEHFEAVRQQLDTLLQRIDDMRSAPRPDQSPLQDRLEQIAGKMDEMRTRPSEDLVLIRRDLASLSAAIETLSPQRLVGMVENAVATMAEKSLLANRNNLPERLLTPITEVHQDVRQILSEMTASRSSDRLSHEVSLIARKLDEIGRQAASPERVEEIFRETDAIKSLIGQAMRAQPLEGLAFHIEGLSKQLETFQRDPVRADEGAMFEAIREIKDRIERIDPHSTFTTLEKRLSAIAGIEQRLDAIANDVSRLSKEAQPFPHLDQIASRLERIDRVLDNSKDQPIAGLDHLAQTMERLGSSLEKASGQSSSDELVQLLEKLSNRMADVEASRTDTAMLDALQVEIARLGEKLDMPGHGQGQGLDGLERAVQTLMGQFEAARADMKDAAASAAERAAKEAIRSIAREETTDTLAAEGLLLLKRDLGEFKSAQSDADKRTRQTLEQLHTTLETLVGRLSGMEGGTPTTRPEAPARREPAPELPRATFTPPIPALDAPTERAKQPSSNLAQRAAPIVAETLDDGNDLPLEPGQRPGHPGASSSAIGQPALSADPRSNFIAAARRAAQVAAEKSQEVLAEEKPDRKSKKATRGVAGVEGSTPTKLSFAARARRPILLGLATLVFTLGAMKLLLTRDNAEIAISPPGGKPSIEQSVPKGDPPIIPADPRGEAPAPAQGQPEKTGSLAPHLNEANGKRTTRLSDSSAITQADPLTVGSISGDGSPKPIDTGREALSELAKETKIAGQDRLREAAISGNTAAIFELGSRLADGRGATRDPKLAARWFEQAAAGGHAPAQYRLASLYREGRGVQRDAAIAFQWFDRAAAQGHVLAMHNAGVLLAEGVHGSPDYAGAALWFRRAAEHGVKDSQFNVAILFARGLGVNQDLGEAFRWFSLAAAQGDQDAIKKRDDVAARLTKEQLAKERERLKTFAPTKANPAANEAGAWDKSAAAMFPPIARGPQAPQQR
jgi:localization factor PodJL